MKKVTEDDNKMKMKKFSINYSDCDNNKTFYFCNSWIINFNDFPLERKLINIKLIEFLFLLYE